MINKIIIILLLSNFHLFSQDYKIYETNWTKDGILTGSSILSSIIGISITDNEKMSLLDFSKLNRNDLNILDKSASFKYNQNLSDLSDYLVVCAMVSPITFISDENIRKDWDKISIMYLENMLFAFALPTIAKSSYRARPYTYKVINGNLEGMENEKLYNADSHRSFFSGHSTVAFASTIFLAKVYSDYYPNSDYKNYVWASSILFASSIAYLRYESGYHFPTDILTGAIVGSALGYIIPEIHKIKNLSVNSGSKDSFYGISVSLKL